MLCETGGEPGVVSQGCATTRVRTQAPNRSAEHTHRQSQQLQARTSSS